MICKEAADGFPEPRPQSGNLVALQAPPTSNVATTPGSGSHRNALGLSGRCGARTPSPGLGWEQAETTGAVQGQKSEQASCPPLQRRPCHGTGRRGSGKSHTISSQSGAGHPGETRPRLPISGSSAPSPRCPPLSAGISQGPLSLLPRGLSPHPAPLEFPISLSQLSPSPAAHRPPAPACLLPSKARSPPAFQPSNTGAPRALSGSRRADPHQHDHPPGAEDDAAGGQLGPAAQKRRHEEEGRGSPSCGRSGKAATGRPGCARGERAGLGSSRRGGRAARSAAKGAWPQVPTIAPGGGPPGPP